MKPHKYLIGQNIRYKDRPQLKGVIIAPVRGGDVDPTFDPAHHDEPWYIVRWDQLEGDFGSVIDAVSEDALQPCSLYRDLATGEVKPLGRICQRCHKTPPDDQDLEPLKIKGVVNRLCAGCYVVEREEQRQRVEAKKKAKAEDLKQNREENDYPEDSWPRCELCGEHPAEKKLPTDNDREFDVCLDCYDTSKPKTCSPDSEKEKCPNCNKPLQMDKSGRYTFCECQALGKRSKEVSWLKQAFSSIHTPPDRRYTNKMIFTRFYNKRQKEE